jgi:putative nucleotidyltransferase with HDIG domain
MLLPTRAQALALLKKYSILPNILEHSLKVNKVAVFLAKKLIEAGEKVNLDVVDRASLLHDIGKSISITEKREAQHPIIAKEILTREGYPELGHICMMHSLREIKNLRTWEEKIVNYADTRVKHSGIVSLKERIEDLTKRYNVPESQRLTYRDLLPLETEIFSKLKIKPNDVAKLVENGK